PIPAPERYEAIYQLGFQNIPDIAIPDYIAREAGVQSVGVWYDLGNIGSPLAPDPYYVLAPRGETSYVATFREFIKTSPIPVVI
ncbi:hypothetical protein, partial [Bacillus cereus]|uniref:hypothetical protein n=1 Tax=Bacillus cereus TaxID=1396 RepID=UPI0034D4CA32